MRYKMIHVEGVTAETATALEKVRVQYKVLKAICIAKSGAPAIKAVLAEISVGPPPPQAVPTMPGLTCAAFFHARNRRRRQPLNWCHGADCLVRRSTLLNA